MNRKRRRSKFTILRAPIVKFLLLVLIVLIGYFVFMNGCKVQEYEIKGCTKYTNDQIIEKVEGDAKTDNAVLIYLKYKFFDNLSIPFIEKLDFKIIGYNKLKITVYEKMVIGCVEFMGEYMYFDKDGIIVESSSSLLENIPLIKGLTFKKVILHEKIETESDSIYASILNLSQLNEKYELGIDTMAFSSNKEITIECDGIKVLLGKRDKFDDVFGDLKGILKEVQGQKLTIDMTNYGEGKSHIYAVPNK